MDKKIILRWVVPAFIVGLVLGYLLPQKMFGGSSPHQKTFSQGACTTTHVPANHQIPTSNTFCWDQMDNAQVTDWSFTLYRWGDGPVAGCSTGWVGTGTRSITCQNLPARTTFKGVLDYYDGDEPYETEAYHTYRTP